MASAKDSVTASVFAAACETPDVYVNKLRKTGGPITDAGDKFISWAEAHKYVDVHEEEVPEGILPKGVTAKLADLKVKAREYDDIIYDSSTELREKVARGNTFLKLDKMPWQCILYAFKKFSGGMGDDDGRDGGGDDIMWKHYFTKPKDQARTVIALVKANGDTAHMSCIKIQDVHYLCVGSQDVHMLIKERSDIEKYVGDRYQYVDIIANTVMDFLETLDKPQVIRLLDFLAETHLTAVLELLNPARMDVENLSYLGDKCALKFIAWTTSEFTAKKDMCILPPDLGCNVAAHLGFDAVTYKVMAPVESEDHMRAIRKRHGAEGEVFYYLDSSYNVIGLLKKKTAWYIYTRNIREKVRNYMTSDRPFNYNEIRTHVCRRISQLQHWLKMADENVLRWQALGAKYIDWMLAEKKAERLYVKEIVDTFPVTWTRFLKEKEMSDDLPYEETLCII